jgi:hypothetical protein
LGDLPTASERPTSGQNQFAFNTWSDAGIEGAVTGMLTTIDDGRPLVQFHFAHRLFQNVITLNLGLSDEATAN